MSRLCTWMNSQSITFVHSALSRSQNLTRPSPLPVAARSVRKSTSRAWAWHWIGYSLMMPPTARSHRIILSSSATETATCCSKSTWISFTFMPWPLSALVHLPLRMSNVYRLWSQEPATTWFRSKSAFTLYTSSLAPFRDTNCRWACRSKTLTRPPFLPAVPTAHLPASKSASTDRNPFSGSIFRSVLHATIFLPASRSVTTTLQSSPTVTACILPKSVHESVQTLMCGWTHRTHGGQGSG
mmetsp:Transcript_113945/g.322593  ORF Transcript_113945/g.322593 Transcript_113945/m.322593 type:complete len:241 (+) Transcript_113945:263-985(+)